MSGPSSKLPSPIEEAIANMSAHIEKLASAFTGIQANQETLHGDNSRLTVAVNRLQSEKLADMAASTGVPQHGKATTTNNTDTITLAAKHGHKLLFPTYDGTEDPLPWLNRCNQFFRIQETSEAGKVFLASFYVPDEASQWFTLLERNQGKPSWEEFVRLINQCFCPPLHSNPLGELIQLRREGTVAKFQSKFMSLLTCCDGLAEKHQINIFTAGLRNPLKTDVELEHPATLEEAIALARAYEQRMSMTKLSPTRSSPLQRSTPSCNLGTGQPLLLPTPTSAVGTKDAAPTLPRLKQLTAAKMAAKREMGKRYNCNEQFSREHLKTCPMKGIYLLQMDDDPQLDDTTETEVSLISLNAITGLTVADAMQLAVHMADQLFGALVDSGSTHSFISVVVASRLHLDPLPLLGLRVKVVNSDHVATVGVRRKTQIYIDLKKFVIDLFGIPLDGYDSLGTSRTTA
jgi:hypothetical protein